MSVGCIFSLLKTTVYEKILILFYVTILITAINPANGAVGDILINNENKLLESGKPWTLYEGYEVTVTALDNERVLISLSKNGKEEHRKGEYRLYSYEYRNPTNISQLILRFRVIHINGNKIQLRNIFQYSSGSVLSHAPESTPTFAASSVPISTSTSTSALFSDDFSDSTLNSGWIVINKNSDSQLLLTGIGILRMIASPKNGGSDYYYNSNYNAIRILFPVPTELQNLDGFVETKMNFLPTNNYQGAGIIVCYDDNPDSNTCDRVAERAFYPKVGGSVVRSGGNYVNYSNITTYFRLMKKGNNFTGWYSSDGANWILNGQGTSTKTGKYVGLFAVRQPWDGDTNVYSAVEFDFFNVSTLPSTISTNIPIITPEPTPTGAISSPLDLNILFDVIDIIAIIFVFVATLKVIYK